MLSWDLKAQNKVLVSILHTEVTTIAWAFGLRNLIVPGSFITPSGMPYDHARNSSVQALLQSQADWLFFLDSDVIPPHDAVLRLLAHNQPLVSGLYCRRSPPAAVPVMIKNGVWLTDFKQGAVIDVDFVGAGCFLIHRTVFENFPAENGRQRWFDWRVDMQGILPPGHCLSEDFHMCRVVREQMGHKILVDTSIQCRHVGYMEATYGAVQPLNCNPIT